MENVIMKLNEQIALEYNSSGYAYIKENIKKILKKLPIPLTKNHKYDLLTVKVIRKTCSTSSNCIDVGCHTGDILTTILRFAPKGQHYCFEPLPHLYEELVSKFPSNCHFYKVGLSDQVGTASFNYVVTNPAYSGFRSREYARNYEKEEVITVQTDLLDNVIPENVKIDFIKVDVEGQKWKCSKEQSKPYCAIGLSLFLNMAKALRIIMARIHKIFTNF
ncbi:MAG: FkbM family methyltransferase [Saprospiraceae bacterium]|nr:FkbM family methyltransferase [Saprospiraceae bacterium]